MFCTHQILARVNLGEELDRASLSEALSEACRKVRLGVFFVEERATHMIDIAHSKSLQGALTAVLGWCHDQRVCAR